MNVDGKELFVVGDRVLIAPEKGEVRTRVGLVLPDTAVEKRAVGGGRVVEVGPGFPLPRPEDMDDEPWKTSARDTRGQYMPLEAKKGDYALFLKSSGIEIQFEDDEYLIVPYGAILVLVREDGPSGVPESLSLDDLGM